MAKVINFPNSAENQKNLIDEITEQNRIFCNGMRDRVGTECSALDRTGDPNAMYVGKIINAIVNNIITTLESAAKSAPNQINIPYLSNQIMHSVNAIMAGGIISPLTGCDEEWHDVTVPDDVGQKFRCTYRGKEYEIDIESVQVNIRYPKIYRLNGDNKYAHRIDFMQFHSATNPNHVNLTEDSIRFIQFPYTMQSAHFTCIIDSENHITDYLDCEYDDIANGLIYGDYTNNDPRSYIIAPKIPFFMLEDEGINIDEEIASYIDEVDYAMSTDSSCYDDDDENAEDAE